MIIAIDGPAASGKGTLSKQLAAHYRLPHLDTGLLYRGVALAMTIARQPLEDAALAEAAARNLKLDDLSDPRLRSAEMGGAASIVAAIPAVRAALLDFQRAFANQPAGAVLDGRDIGTVVAPHADAKLFVTATAEERARRRVRELRGRGAHADEAQILADIQARDARDGARSVAPLKAAPDARLLDTTNLDIDAAFRAAVALIDGA
ncbi:cytidylate kinase [Agaricicola taiwanensis]|uniref:Cytidylate kinase n=2 Tax=Agaricicola taiwanensis TaxID=591372 RepID=A0A8J2YBD1_9RHOB|nr:cytidylate kinase [Agaricicola taiwanensis]